MAEAQIGFAASGRSGCWKPGHGNASGTESLEKTIRHIARPLYLVMRDGNPVAESSGTAALGLLTPESGSFPLIAHATPVLPDLLGDPGFSAEMGIRYPYLAGSMAKGISSAKMAEELGRAGMLGFFGAAGLPLHEVEKALDRLKESLGNTPYGFNLIHSPQ